MPFLLLATSRLASFPGRTWILTDSFRRPPYLQQTSLAPIGAKSLWFLWQGERLDLRINGQLVPFHLAEQRLTDDPFVPIHNYYAADIRQFAGQEVTVRFEFFANELHPFPPWPGAVQALDDVYFSTIPEPDTGTLLVFGLGWLPLARRRGRRDERINMTFVNFRAASENSRQSGVGKVSGGSAGNT